MTHKSKGLFSKHNVKSVYMNYRELFDESTMFEDIFIERLQPEKHYSILAKVCYTTEEQELFLTLGDQVGVYLEEGLSEKEHKWTLRKVSNIFKERLNTFIDFYRIKQVVWVQFTYVELQVDNKLRLKNINKIPLPSELVGDELEQFKLIPKVVEGYFISSKTYCLVLEDGLG